MKTLVFCLPNESSMNCILTGSTNNFWLGEQRSHELICAGHKITSLLPRPEKQPIYVQYRNKKGNRWNAGFYGKNTPKSTVLMSNFKIHEKNTILIFNIQHIILFKYDKCLSFRPQSIYFLIPASGWYFKQKKYLNLFNKNWKPIQHKTLFQKHIVVIMFWRTLTIKTKAKENISALRINRFRDEICCS